MIAHLLRQRARRLVLQKVSADRNDREGLDCIDLEATSHKIFKQWTQSLPPREAAALCIWRSGAVWTPTRRRRRRNACLTVCPWCNCEKASARRYFADCNAFSDLRQSLQNRFNIDQPWWTRQPRCTSKSGWVTITAAASLQTTCYVCRGSKSTWHGGHLCYAAHS